MGRVRCCTFCENTYSAPGELDNHLRRHICERPFTCQVCGDTFSSNRGFNQHLLVHSDRSNKWSCRKCNRKFLTKRGYTDHMKLHTGGAEHKCDVCSKEFANKQTAERHRMLHSRTEPAPKPHSCIFCFKAFRNGQGLEDHILRHINENPFNCVQCDFICTSKTILRAHHRVHFYKPVKCNICFKNLKTMQILKSHKKLMHGNVAKKFRCSLCPYTTSYKSGLDRHVRAHTGEKAYQCGVCNKRYTSKQGLKAHSGIHCPELKAQLSKKCEICGMELRSLSSLKVHLSTHTDLKPYQCELCPKAFKQKYALKMHVATHIGENLFKCRFCDESFANPGSRCSHEKRRHRNGNPEVPCPICHNKFRKDGLKTHMMRKHSQTKTTACTFCSKMFVSRQEVLSHVRTHIKEALEWCNKCGVEFYCKRFKQSHLKMCEGVK